MTDMREMTPQEDALLLSLIKSDATGDFYAKKMALEAKKALPEMLEALRKLPEAIEQGRQAIPASSKYMMVEAIMQRLYAEMEASCDRAYKDLDAVLHDQEVVIA